MITYYCPNMKEPLRPATTGPLNAGISIGQIDLHKQAATTSRQIIAKISKKNNSQLLIISKLAVDKSDSVGTVGECAIEVPTMLFFIVLRRNIDTL